MRDLVLMILLRIDAEQRLDAGEQAVLVEPDFAVVGIEADQLQLGIVPALLVPGGRPGIPQAVDGGAVVVRREAAFDAGEQIVALGGILDRGGTACAQIADQVGVLGREEPRRDRVRP